MLLTTLSVLLVVLVAIGWGAWVWKWLDRGRQSFQPTTGELGLLGVVWLSGVGILLNFVLPLSTSITTLVAAAGLTNVALQRRMFDDKHMSRGMTLCAIVVLAFACGFLAYIREVHGDTDLYHLPTLIWLTESRAPIGIANLVGQLGFNSSWFVFAGLFRLPGLEWTTVFAVDAAVVVLLIVALFPSALRTVRGGPFLASGLFAVGVIGFVFSAGFNFIKIVGSPNTDIPAAIFTIYAFYLAIRLAEIRADSKDFTLCWLLLVVSTVFAVMIKLSQILVLAIPVGYAFWYWRTQKSVDVDRSAIAVLAFLGIVGVGWIIRGLFSSGCVAFPAPSSCVTALPWAISKKFAALHQGAVRAYGIAVYGSDPGWRDWGWVPGWWARFSHHHFPRGMVYFFATSVSALVGTWIYRRWNDVKLKTSWTSVVGGNRIRRVSVGLTAYLMLCTAFWFVTAPDIRFSYGYLVSLAVLVAILIVSIGDGLCVKVFARILATTTVVSLFLVFVKLFTVTERGDWLAPWPRIEPKTLPSTSCPDLLGIWKTYHCRPG